VPDVKAVAAPLTVNDKTLAIAIAGPMHRMAPRAERHGPTLLAVHRALERAE
jgi:hypothetical protein